MNTKSILLAYASRYGSTQEVAETISSGLSQYGFEVDVQPMRDVEGLATYDAVVLGAAIYNGRWHQDAHQFLTRHKETLIQRPVAIFVLGPLSKNEAVMKRSRRQLDKELEQYPWLKPAAVEVFVGKYNPAKLSFFERLTPASDNRDWNAIRAWANSLPAQLQHAQILRPT